VLVVLTSAATAAVVALAGLTGYQARAGRQQVRALERELAEAYGHFAEVQGSTAEAARAYSTMIEISKRLWEADPSDPRALANYGAAQLGLGMAIPLESRAEKQAALERARDWLTEAVRLNAANTQLRTELDTATAALASLGTGDASR
jgi:hypothetical protein